jgi:hypothetical protein
MGSWAVAEYNDQGLFVVTTDVDDVYTLTARASGDDVSVSVA